MLVTEAYQRFRLNTDGENSRVYPALAHVPSELFGICAQQVEEAVRVNTEARLRALKIGPLIMAGPSLLAVIPAGRLPNYLPGEIRQCAGPQLPDQEERGTEIRR